ncbi:MAG: hypothetical protein QGH66_05205 [Dehalococcoidia bacterium]|jgi:hypothetical protein|nr:hypothetical protein [Dehalococcoidia bacterium]
MGDMLIGTCSWTDPELIKASTFYPRPSISAEERQCFYSNIFPEKTYDFSVRDKDISKGACLSPPHTDMLMFVQR